jgi:hypothetical protein
MRSYLDYLIRVGFVDAQNKNLGFVVQIPEGLYFIAETTSNVTHYWFQGTSFRINEP